MPSANPSEVEPLLNHDSLGTSHLETDPLEHLLLVLCFLILYQTRDKAKFVQNFSAYPCLPLEGIAYYPTAAQPSLQYYPGVSESSCKIGSWDLPTAHNVIHAVAVVISIGFWGHLGDRFKSRKPVLLIILSGLLLLDLITILVVKSAPEDPPAIWLLIDTACNGLLGGSATIYALLRAYAVDFSLPGQRDISLVILQGFIILSGIVGGLLFGLFSWSLFGSDHPVLVVQLAIIPFILSAITIFCVAVFFPIRQRSCNLVSQNFIFTALSPFMVFVSSSRMRLLGLAVFSLSMTSNDSINKLFFYFKHNDLPILYSAYIWIVLLVVQVIGTLVTVPALTIYYHITPSLRANQLLATMIGLLATVSDLLAFIPSLHERMFMLFGIFIPAFIVNNLMPLLFTIGTMYFDAVGRSQEIGFLLSAMAGLQNFGGVLSYYIFLAIMEDPSTGPKSAFLLTPGLLAFTTLSLFLLRGWKTPNPHALVEPPEETSSLPTPAEENTTNSSNISV